MTVKELRAVLKLAADENAEIQFLTEPGVAFRIHGFDNSEEEFWILLNTLEWENRLTISQLYGIINISKEREVREMEEEIFDPCENCPYDDNGWCCCEGDLPDDALCMEEYEDD